jgi:hypothetical protein
LRVTRFITMTTKIPHINQLEAQLLHPENLLHISLVSLVASLILLR